MKNALIIALTTFTFLLASCSHAGSKTPPPPPAPKPTPRASLPQKPNIVFILADDLGYGDLGSYGQKEILTPNLDALRAGGMKFTDAYAAPVCAPSRCSLLTGLTTGHCFIRANKKENLRPEDFTVTELLHNAGYDTCVVGKWSMGEVGSSGDPTHKGVNYFYGFIDQTHAHNSYPSYLYRNETKVPLPNVIPNEMKYGQGVATVKKAFANDLFDDEITTYLQQQAKSKQPFFLYAPFTAPHANNEAKENEVPDLGIYKDKKWPLPERQYAALVTRLDTYVGHIMQTLKEQGLDKNTLVIFASDNGPQEEGGTRVPYLNSGGPLRGIKLSVYEGGIRIPFIASWPGVIAPHSISYTPIVFYDFMATAADLAHLPTPHTDGISFLPTLLGDNDHQPQHTSMYWEVHEHAFEQAVRVDEDGHKWKAVRHGLSSPIELYDLRTDIGEAHNVASEHPGVLGRMTRLFIQSHTESQEYPSTN